MGCTVGAVVGACVGQAVSELSTVAWRFVHVPPHEALHDSVRVRVAGPQGLLQALHDPYLVTYASVNVKVSVNITTT